MNLVSLDEFLRDPIGSAAATEHATVWMPRPGLRVIALRGRPSEADAAWTVRVMRREIEANERYRSMVDVRDLEHVDPAPFARLTELVSGNRARFAELVVRSAIVHSGGVGAAIAAGYARLTGDPFPSQLFERPRDALEWLGYRAERDALVDDYAVVLDRAASTAPLVHALRRAMRADRTLRSLEGSARSLGVSSRTLQRALHDAGTSLRHEARAVRIDKAKQLLLDSDRKLLAVAIDVGFRKLDNFTRAFRDATGMTPAAWRARQRPRGV